MNMQRIPKSGLWENTFSQHCVFPGFTLTFCRFLSSDRKFIFPPYDIYFLKNVLLSALYLRSQRGPAYHPLLLSYAGLWLLLLQLF